MYKRVELNNERLVLQLIKKMLIEGNSQGLMESDYYKIIDGFMKLFESKGYVENLEKIYTVKSEGFHEIYAKLTKDAKVPGFDYNHYRGVISPNYDLKATAVNTGQLQRFEEQLLYQSLSSNIKTKKKIETKQFSSEVLQKAEATATFFVEKLTQRYVEKAIGTHNWPVQCLDSTEFVFEKDLGKILNLPLTKASINKLYKNSVKEIGNIILENEALTRKTIFSNDKTDLLAYSNYLRLLSQNFEYLINLEYNSKEKTNQKIEVFVIDEVKYNTSEVTHFNTFNEKKTFAKSNGVVDQEQVKALVLKLK